MSLLEFVRKRVVASRKTHRAGAGNVIRGQGNPKIVYSFPLYFVHYPSSIAFLPHALQILYVFGKCNIYGPNFGGNFRILKTKCGRLEKDFSKNIHPCLCPIFLSQNT